MEQALYNAIAARMKQGHSRENIINELIAAGYTPEMAASVYDEIAGETTVTPNGVTDRPPVSSAPPPVQPSPVPSAAPTPPASIVEPVPAASMASAPTAVPPTPTSVAAPVEAPPAPPTPTPPTPPQPRPVINSPAPVVAVSDQAEIPATPPSPSVAATPVPSSSPAVSESAYSDSLSQRSKKAKRSAMVPIVAAGVLLLLLAGVGWWVFQSGVLSGLKTASGDAPYETVSELMEGVLTQNETTKAGSFSLGFELAFAPLQESTPIIRTGESELTDAILEDAARIPRDGHFKFDYAGLVDMRDEENMELDATIAMNVLFEPIFFNFVLSGILDDGVAYVRFDDIPTMMEMALSTMPLGEWMVMEDGSSFLDEIDPGLAPDILPMVQNTKESHTYAYVASELNRWKPFRQQLATKDSQSSWWPGQLANTIQAYGMNVSAEEQFEQQVTDKLVEVVIAHPPFQLVGEPAAGLVNEEAVFQYTVAVDYDGMRAMLYELNATMAEFSAPLPEEMLAELIPPRSSVELFNRLFTFVVSVRADGSIAGTEFSGLIGVPSAKGGSEVSLRMIAINSRHDDGMSIEKPDEVYGRTFEEVMDDVGPEDIPIVGSSLEDAQRSGREASIKQTMASARNQTELYYNMNNFSYAGACQSVDLAFLFESIAMNAGVTEFINDGPSSNTAITCNDSVRSYAIHTPLSFGSIDSWCVDSTGFAGAVGPYALDNRDDTSCSEEWGYDSYDYYDY